MSNRLESNEGIPAQEVKPSKKPRISKEIAAQKALIKETTRYLNAPEAITIEYPPGLSEASKERFVVVNNPDGSSEILLGAVEKSTIRGLPLSYVNISWLDKTRQSLVSMRFYCGPRVIVMGFVTEGVAEETVNKWDNGESIGFGHVTRPRTLKDLQQAVRVLKKGTVNSLRTDKRFEFLNREHGVERLNDPFRPD